MAIIYPELTEVQLRELPSRAEAKVYRSLRDSLGADFIVFFQVSWILKRENAQARDGEADFIICHPNRGYLCVEVKGGGIRVDGPTDAWFSIDRDRVEHQIKNPVRQALNAKFSVLAKLEEIGAWQTLRLRNVTKGHAVFFPDVADASKLARPDLPAGLIGTYSDLRDPVTWVDGAFSYWEGQEATRVRPGMRGLEVMKAVFARSASLPPLMAAHLADIETRRLTLTQEQLRALDLLRALRRVAISGGAGTGKTVLALEKARRLASEGFRTLLTCYNRQLADFLAEQCEGIENLDVLGFHQLCYREVTRADRASGRDLEAEARGSYPGANTFDVILPNALAYAVDVLPERYDAIVCDEGQDFREEYWLPLEMLLSDGHRSPFYIFYDDNQNLYSRASTFPVPDEPFPLTVNCRNTAPIHVAAYARYRGDPVDPPDNPGEEVRYERASTTSTQAKRIVAIVTDLIVREGVRPEDIVILVADAYRKLEYYVALERLSLPRPAVWHQEGRRADNAVLLETVSRFKGLESPVIILWGLDSIDRIANPEVLYVGMSRAKSLLFVVGNESTCSSLNQDQVALS